MITLTIRSVGNSNGVIFPNEAMDWLQVKKGDRIHLTKSPDGYHITPYDPEFERDMTIAEDVMKRYRNALRELSK